MYEVVVIGGGPVGSQVAYKLAGMGYSVVVLEQKEKLGEPVCCTGIISKECASSFAINEDVIYRWVNSAKVFSPSGKQLYLWRQERQACIVDRAALNVSLALKAESKGVKYILSSQVKGIEVSDGGVRIEVNNPEGRSASFRASVVVIATGFNSRLVDRLGLGRVNDFVMGAQAEVDRCSVDEVEVYLGSEIAPAFFAWLIPTSPQRALVGLLSRSSPGLYLKKLLSSLEHVGKIASTEAKLNYGGIPLKPLPRTYGDRMIVVGTAAGQVKPTSGGGIYYGLLCADVAANTLNEALKQDGLSARDLAGYDKEWKRKLGQELKVGYWAHKFYERLSDAQVDKIFDIIQSNGIDEVLLNEDDLSFDWHSSAILKSIGHRALARFVKTLKVPFPTRGRSKGN